MKVIITESQLYDLIPPKLKRKYSHIHVLTDTLFNGEDMIMTMTQKAKSSSFDEFMKFVIRFVESWLIIDITNDDLNVIKNSIRIIIHDRIKKFWEEVNGVK